MKEEACSFIHRQETKFSKSFVIKTDMGWKQRMWGFLVKQIPNCKTEGYNINIYKFYWVSNQILASSLRQFLQTLFSKYRNQYRRVHGAFRLNKSTLELSFFLSSTSQSKLLPLMFASASHSFNENHNSYIFSSCLCWPNKENQSRNNDKLCVVERNWLNCSGFCGLSVLSHKQLVIAINIYFMYVLLEPTSQQTYESRFPTISHHRRK